MTERLRDTALTAAVRDVRRTCPAAAPMLAAGPFARGLVLRRGGTPPGWGI
ncbi:MULTISPECIES: hypothetical protein [unclassified Streptomyces]|uniref:hypothetical protein n=1 Tax=unclassified Streptomyces TaxID=2593676 RepID=UPI00371DD9AD